MIGSMVDYLDVWEVCSMSFRAKEDHDLFPCCIPGCNWSANACADRKTGQRATCKEHRNDKRQV